MLKPIIRYLKRFAVLLPGLAIAYVSVQNIFPLIDSQTPKLVAFLATYVLAAYVLIPAVIRAWRLFVPPKHLPIYCVTPDGFASDPINIGIIGNRQQLVEAMQHAGWHVADSHSLHNLLREIISTLLRKPYPSAPMSSLYLFGRHQDIGFEIQIVDQFKNRHHVRFWATTYDQPLSKLQTAENVHWFPRRQLRDKQTEQLLWLGAASKDIGLALIRHNAQLTHMIHPDTDQERDLIADQLLIDGAELITTISLMKPYKLTNRVWRGYLQTDGRLKVIQLRPQSQPSLQPAVTAAIAAKA